MKKVFFGIVAIAAIAFASCNQPKAEAPVEEPVVALDSAVAVDSALKVLGVETLEALEADSVLKAQFDSIFAALTTVPEVVEEVAEEAVEAAEEVAEAAEEVVEEAAEAVEEAVKE